MSERLDMTPEADEPFVGVAEPELAGAYRMVGAGDLVERAVQSARVEAATGVWAAEVAAELERVMARVRPVYRGELAGYIERRLGVRVTHGEAR